MKQTLIAFLLLTCVTACNQTTDVFCQTHTQDQFMPSASVFAVQTPTEKRNSLEILQEGQKRCGWKPNR